MTGRNDNRKNFSGGVLAMIFGNKADNKNNGTKNEKAVGEVIEKFSFEVREPLNSICGIAEVLSRYAKEQGDRGQLRSYTELLKSSTDKLQETIDAYLRQYTDVFKDEEEKHHIDEDDDFKCLHNLRLMVVEDSETNRIIIKELLEAYGVIVTECADGAEAVEKFKDSIPGTYDVIFMDIKMPNMDGYEATDRIRHSGHPQGKSIPIVATTAEVLAEDVQTALRAGMNAHIAKPYKMTKIVSTLRTVLKR